VSKSDVFRDGKLHVQKHMCDTCIFRPGNLMSLMEGRVEDMVATCIRNQSTIPCHKKLNGKGQAVCRGFFDNHAPDVPPLQIAERLGLMVEVVLR
jgi:hypothetical protein